MISKFLRVSQSKGEAVDVCAPVADLIRGLNIPGVSVVGNIVTALDPTLSPILKNICTMLNASASQPVVGMQNMIKPYLDSLDISGSNFDASDLSGINDGLGNILKELKKITAAVTLHGLPESTVYDLLKYAVSKGAIPSSFTMGSEADKIIVRSFAAGASHLGTIIYSASLGALKTFDENPVECMKAGILAFIAFQYDVERTKNLINSMSQKDLFGLNPLSALYDLLENNREESLVDSMTILAFVGEKDTFENILTDLSDLLSPLVGKTMKDLFNTVSQYQLYSTAAIAAMSKIQQNIVQARLRMLIEWAKDSFKLLDSETQIYIIQMFNNLAPLFAAQWGAQGFLSAIKPPATTALPLSEKKSKNKNQKTIQAQVVDSALDAKDAWDAVIQAATAAGLNITTTLREFLKTIIGPNTTQGPDIVTNSVNNYVEANKILAPWLQGYSDRLSRSLSNYMVGTASDYVARLKKIVLRAFKLSNDAELQRALDRPMKSYLERGARNLIEIIKSDKSLASLNRPNEDTLARTEGELGLALQSISIYTSGIDAINKSIDAAKVAALKELNKFSTSQYGTTETSELIPETLDTFINDAASQIQDAINFSISGLAKLVKLGNPGQLIMAKLNTIASDKTGEFKNHIAKIALDRLKNSLKEIFYRVYELIILKQQIFTEVQLRKLQVEIEYVQNAKKAVLNFSPSFAPLPMSLRLFNLFMEKNRELDDLEKKILSPETGNEFAQIESQLAPISAFFAIPIQSMATHRNSYLKDVTYRIEGLKQKNNLAAFEELDSVRPGKRTGGW